LEKILRDPAVAPSIVEERLLPAAAGETMPFPPDPPVRFLADDSDQRSGQFSVGPALRVRDISGFSGGLQGPPGPEGGLIPSPLDNNQCPHYKALGSGKKNIFR
jgi:hypothetical protein